jgi:hypothetical protein
LIVPFRPKSCGKRIGVPLSKCRTAFPTVATGALSEIRVQDGQFSLLPFNFFVSGRPDNKPAKPFE